MWAKIKAFFAGSETIFWARLHVFVGSVGAVLAVTDLSPLLATGMPTKAQLLLFSVVFLQGVFTEYLRRRRATDL